MMEYKGYLAKVEYDDEAGLFHGQVINIRDVITFQGQSVEELRSALVDSVEDYLDFCNQRNREPEKPFSGRFLVRVEPMLHREIAVAASRANQSINAWVTGVLRYAVQSRPTEPQISRGRFIQQVHGRLLNWDVAGGQLQTVELQIAEQVLSDIARQSTMLPRNEIATAARGHLVLSELDLSSGELIYLGEKDPVNAA